MAKKARQFRYYAEAPANSENTKNFPTTLNKSDLSEGKPFEKCYPIIQLGIQAIPGTKFTINGNLSDIIIGPVGMYEIDLTNTTGSITDLRFDEKSLSDISSLLNAYLIVDIVYEED